MRRWTFYLMRVLLREAWRTVAPHLLTADSEECTEVSEGCELERIWIFS